MIKRYMIVRNGKTIGFADTEKEAFELVKSDLNVKKDFEYGIKDLDKEVYVSVGAYVSDLKKQARWTKRKKKVVKSRVKRNDIVDDEYSAWLGKQPCVVTGQVAVRGVGAYNMHCHHVHGRNGVRNDYMQVPLMGYVHSWGRKSYHSCAKSDFIKYHGLAVDDLIEYFEEQARKLKAEYDCAKIKPKKQQKNLDKGKQNR